MTDSEYCSVIEMLNAELKLLKNRKEVRFCNTCLQIQHFMKKGMLKNIKKIFFDYKAARIIEKKYIYPVEKITSKRNDIDYTRAKIAVYTCVSNRYDIIPEPLLNFPNVSYFAFVDDGVHPKSSNWIYRTIPNRYNLNTPIMQNRYLKFHPTDFFSDYDFSIYVDGNIRIVSDVRNFIQFPNSKTGLAMHVHGKRDCLYDEAEVCLLYHRGNEKKIKEQVNKYHKSGFPVHFGLNEANVIVCDLKNKKAGFLLNEWWNEFLTSGSLRDQLAWPYVLWKNGLLVSDVGCLGIDVYNNPKLDVLKHL